MAQENPKLRNISLFSAPNPARGAYRSPSDIRGDPQDKVLATAMVLRSREFVGSLVRLFVRCDFSKTTSPIIMKFGTDVQHLCRISL